MKILIFVLFLLGFATTYFYIYKNKQKSQPFREPSQVKTNNAPQSANTSNFNTIATTVDNDFNRAVDYLHATLSNWDPNYIITGTSISFADTVSDLKKIYGGDAPNVHYSFWIYSQTYNVSRLYSGGANSLTTEGKGADMSPYGVKYQKLQPAYFIPASPKKAIEKCLDYAVQEGQYYLTECGEILLTDSTTRENWMCDFVGVNETQGKTYVFETQFDSNNYKICYYDTKTDRVSDWLDGAVFDH